MDGIFWNETRACQSVIKGRENDALGQRVSMKTGMAVFGVYLFTVSFGVCFERGMCFRVAFVATGKVVT